MFNKGDKIELTDETVFGWGVLCKGVQGTFIEYRYGISIDGEFYEYDSPSCAVELDPIKGTCVVDEHEIRKVRG